MMRNYGYDYSKIQDLVEIVHREFPDFTVKNILDVGSRAKGEVNNLSDYDFQITVYSDNAILLDPQNINSDISPVEVSLVEFPIAQTYALPIERVEREKMENLVKQWYKQSNMKSGFIFCDYHSFWFNLAFEMPFSAFRTHWFTLTSEVVYEQNKSFFEAQKMLIQHRCHHWFPTIQLQVARYSKHLKLLQLQKDLLLSDSETDRSLLGLKWTTWALNYIRFAIGTWTLLKFGYYEYKRDNVLKFLAVNVPNSYDLVETLYRWKIDPSYRSNIGNMLLSQNNHNKLLAEEMYLQIENLLSTCAVGTNRYVKTYKKVRRVENATTIMQLAKQYIYLPHIDIISWVKDANVKASLVLAQLGNQNS